ncbi:MAG: alanine dehydrogenase, partial [Natronospirillum sp.]
QALNYVSLPFSLTLANLGAQAALHQDKHLRNGLNVCRGQVTNRHVAEARGYRYVAPEEMLAQL